MIVVESCEQESCGACGVDHPTWHTLYSGESWPEIFDFIHSARHLLTSEKYKRMFVKHTHNGSVVYLWFLP